MVVVVVVVVDRVYNILHCMRIHRGCCYDVSTNAYVLKYALNLYTCIFIPLFHTQRNATQEDLVIIDPDLSDDYTPEEPLSYQVRTYVG